MNNEWRQEQTAKNDADSERNVNQQALESDPSFSYYLNNDCPDKHITQAMHGLICRRLSEWQYQNSENQAEMSTTPDGEALRIRWLIAVNPNTPPSVLETLANSSCPDLLERIAENPATGSVTLARLGFDPSPAVRAAVAENSKTPAETVQMLARDENVDVRYRLAESYHVPVAVLQELAEDENPYVAHRARMTLQRIARSESPADVHTLRALSAVKSVFRMNLG